MEKIKKYIFFAALNFTLVSCALYTLLAVAEEERTGITFGLTADNAFLMLLLSLLMGFSFAIFDINKLPRTAKRIIHIIVTFAITVASVLVLHQAGEGDKTMLVFIACFAFLAVYFLCMLICHGLRKLEIFLANSKK